MSSPHTLFQVTSEKGLKHLGGYKLEIINLFVAMGAERGVPLSALCAPVMTSAAPLQKPHGAEREKMYYKT